GSRGMAESGSEGRQIARQRPFAAVPASSAAARSGDLPRSRSRGVGLRAVSGRESGSARGLIYPAAMPFYQRLGDVPRKRHVQFRENGTLLTEEVMGLEGFVGNESILYHLQSPCRVMELAGFEPIERDEWVPDQHAHRHF